MANFRILLSSSSFFTFIVGNNRKPVVVPDNLFEDVSDVLNNKIHGAMKEGIEKQSEINDIDWEVFVGLCEYAYTKDYYDTLPFGEESEEASAETGQMSIDKSLDFDESCSDCGHECKLHNLYTHHGNVCPNCEYETPQDTQLVRCAAFKAFQDTLDGAPSRSGNSKSMVVTSKTLCFHAELAILSQRYLIKDLKNLCIANLHQTLLCYELKRSNTNAILDLLHVVYNEDGVDGVPQLREITLLFLVAHIDFLREDEKLKKVILENGQLGADLVEKLSE